MPNYHFEDDQVLAAVANTEYAKGKIAHHLLHMTVDQKWSLYRAIVKLAEEQRDKPGRALFVCQRCGAEVGDGEQDRDGCHPYCGGPLDPIGEVQEE